jgi:hypothetical protein
MEKRSSLAQAVVALQVPFAEAFRRTGSLDRALLCAAKSAKAHAPLTALANEALRSPTSRLLEEFLILHEMAHFSYDTGQSYAQPVQDIVSTKLEEHCLSNVNLANLLKAGSQLPRNIETSVSQDPAARQIMLRQIAEYVSHVRGHPEIVREASCDYLAVAGLLSRYAGIDVLDGEAPHPVPIPPRRVCDILMIGLRASRPLVVNGFVGQVTSRIADAGDASILGEPYSLAVARQNVVTNLVMALFDSVLQLYEFAPDPQIESEALVERFYSDVNWFNQRSADILFKAVETVGLFHRDKAAVAVELDSARSEIYSSGGDPLTEYDALEALLEKAPF